MLNLGETPYELLALLLLTLPLVFTFTKLLELLAFGERNHQLAVLRSITHITRFDNSGFVASLDFTYLSLFACN